MAITPEGEIKAYIHANGTVHEVREDEWRCIALRSAAKWYPELKELIPKRPDDALKCEDCDGVGTFRETIWCSTCYGLGCLKPGAEASGLN